MIDITIRSLELKDTETLEGVVDRVKTIVTLDNTSMFRTFYLEDPDPQTFVGLESVTDALVRGWVKPHFNEELPQIKDQVLAQNKQKEKKAIKVKDPQTGEVSYTREKHVKEWKPGKVYEKGQRLYYTWETTETVDGKEEKKKHSEFYEVAQAHTSAVGDEPINTAALYSPTTLFDDDRPKWKKPKGPGDAYPVGFEVAYKDLYYRSMAPANEGEPTKDPTLWVEIDPNAQKSVGSSSIETIITAESGGTKSSSGEASLDVIVDPVGGGAKSISGEVNVNISPEGSGGPVYPLWVKPKKTEDNYSTGDVVTYGGSEWISKIDANMEEPTKDKPLHSAWEPYDTA